MQVVKDLLASYDVITSTDNQGNTALNVAAYIGYLTVVEVLISSSPSITSIPNNYGDTFLHMAVAGFRSPGFRRLDHQIELIKQLVSGKLVNVQDIINVGNNDGRTALHMAVIDNIQSDLVELLMTVPSIDLNIRDADGMTPLDLLKQRPRSASSEILIKRLISAGGISNRSDHMARSALVCHPKMWGIGRRSPGASFRIPDAEIFLYTGLENASDAYCDPASTEYSNCSSELSNFNSSAVSNNQSDHKKSRSVKKAARRLRTLLRWPRKERIADKLGDDDSSESSKMCSNLDDSPTSPRQKFSEHLSPPNNKRILTFRNNLPSPSTKKNFVTRLMHGVIQAGPQFSVQSASSPFPESSGLSPISIYNKQKCVETRNEIEEPSCSNHSLGEILRINPKNSPYNKKLMNQFFCFGAQGLAEQDSIISHPETQQSYRHSSSLVA